MNTSTSTNTDGEGSQQYILVPSNPVEEWTVDEVLNFLISMNNSKLSTMNLKIARAAQRIMQIAQNDENKCGEIVKKNALDIICTIIDNTTDTQHSDLIFQASLAAIAVLSPHHMVKQHPSNKNAFHSISKIIKKHKDDVNIIQIAFQTLCNYSFHHSKIALESNIIKDIADIIEHYKDKQTGTDIYISACDIYMNIVAEQQLRDKLGMIVIPSMLCGMHHFRKQNVIIDKSLDVIRRVCIDTPINGQILLKSMDSTKILNQVYDDYNKSDSKNNDIATMMVHILHPIASEELTAELIGIDDYFIDLILKIFVNQQQSTDLYLAIMRTISNLIFTLQDVERKKKKQKEEEKDDEKKEIDKNVDDNNVKEIKEEKKEEQNNDDMEQKETVSMTEKVILKFIDKGLLKYLKTAIIDENNKESQERSTLIIAAICQTSAELVKMVVANQYQLDILKICKSQKNISSILLERSLKIIDFCSESFEVQLELISNGLIEYMLSDWYKGNDVNENSIKCGCHIISHIILEHAFECYHYEKSLKSYIKWHKINKPEISTILNKMEAFSKMVSFGVVVQSFILDSNKFVNEINIKIKNEEIPNMKEYNEKNRYYLSLSYKTMNYVYNLMEYRAPISYITEPCLKKLNEINKLIENKWLEKELIDKQQINDKFIDDEPDININIIGDTTNINKRIKQIFDRSLLNKIESIQYLFNNNENVNDEDKKTLIKDINNGWMQERINLIWLYHYILNDKDKDNEVITKLSALEYLSKINTNIHDIYNKYFNALNVDNINMENDDINDLSQVIDQIYDDNDDNKQENKEMDNDDNKIGHLIQAEPGKKESENRESQKQQQQEQEEKENKEELYDNDNLRDGCNRAFIHFWTETVKLPRYIQVFIDNDSNDIRMMQFIDDSMDDTLKNEYGIKNTLHRKLILKKCKYFNESRQEFQANIKKEFGANIVEILANHGIVTMDYFVLFIEKRIHLKTRVNILNVKYQQNLWRLRNQYLFGSDTNNLHKTPGDAILL